MQLIFFQNSLSDRCFLDAAGHHWNKLWEAEIPGRRLCKRLDLMLQVLL